MSPPYLAPPPGHPIARDQARVSAGVVSGAAAAAPALLRPTAALNRLVFSVHAPARTRRSALYERLSVEGDGCHEAVDQVVAHWINPMDYNSGL